MESYSTPLILLDGSELQIQLRRSNSLTSPRRSRSGLNGAARHILRLPTVAQSRAISSSIRGRRPSLLHPQRSPITLSDSSSEVTICEALSMHASTPCTVSSASLYAGSLERQRMAQSASNAVGETAGRSFPFCLHRCQPRWRVSR